MNVILNQEIRKLESRVNLLVKEKSSLLGQVAVAERKVTELDKRNGILESQVMHAYSVLLIIITQLQSNQIKTSTFHNVSTCLN